MLSTSQTLKISIPLASKPQGSKNIYRTPKGQTVVVEASKNLKTIRQQFSDLIAKAAEDQGWIKPPKNTPITLNIVFTFKRGKTVTRQHHTTVPDGDKLNRFIGDAITRSGIWLDDAQVTHWTGSKQYGDTDQTDITISY